MSRSEIGSRKMEKLLWKLGSRVQTFIPQEAKTRDFRAKKGPAVEGWKMNCRREATNTRMFSSFPKRVMPLGAGGT